MGLLEDWVVEGEVPEYLGTVGERRAQRAYVYEGGTMTEKTLERRALSGPLHDPRRW